MASRVHLGLIINEQWNIWTSSGYVMRKIVTTCIPAWFQAFIPRSIQKT